MMKCDINRHHCNSITLLFLSWKCRKLVLVLVLQCSPLEESFDKFSTLAKNLVLPLKVPIIRCCRSPPSWKHKLLTASSKLKPTAKPFIGKRTKFAWEWTFFFWYKACAPNLAWNLRSAATKFLFNTVILPGENIMYYFSTYFQSSDSNFAS